MNCAFFAYVERELCYFTFDLREHTLIMMYVN